MVYKRAQQIILLLAAASRRQAFALAGDLFLAQGCWQEYLDRYADLDFRRLPGRYLPVRRAIDLPTRSATTACESTIS